MSAGNGCRKPKHSAVIDRRYRPRPPSPRPPVIFVISDCAKSFPCAIACFTPLSTASCRNSTSSGSTISFAILIETTSPEPLATTVTLPPAAWTSTVLSSSSACVLAICSCIFCACFINLLMFIVGQSIARGFNFAFENFKRFADQRIVFEGRGRFRRSRRGRFCRRDDRQSFLHHKFYLPILTAHLFQNCVDVIARLRKRKRFHRRLLFWRKANHQKAAFNTEGRACLHPACYQASGGADFLHGFLPRIFWIGRRLLLVGAGVGDPGRSGLSNFFN